MHTNLFITDNKALWDALINAYDITCSGYMLLQTDSMHYSLHHQHGAIYPGVLWLWQELR